MADLYSKSKLREAASTFENMDLSAEIEILQQLSRDFQAKSTENETQYEQIFNDLFFGQLLGYENGKHRIPQAGTPIGGKRADLALGFFEDNKYNFEGVRVMVELKSSNISLDHKQYGHGGQTPVDQGFGYKTAFKDCSWLIVSNFASIRLYRDNKQDFQGWTLEQLLDPENQYFHLRSLLGLLKRNYLIGERGTIARSEHYLSEFRIQQEKISKAFYKEYSELRLELINDIKYHNPTLDVETLVSKAQKIIDRIIFIHFCEDYGLLPEGKLLEVIEHNKSLINISIWQILTGFFEAVNTGSSKLWIPNGYNGGLFAKDQVLDALKVGDTICKKFVEIGKYDFAEELSVNVLGHIFEQSISDIEQLKIDLLGETLETEQLVEKKTSKRKKDGIFYTPEYIVDYIVQNSLGKYLSEKEESCLHKHRNKKNGEQLAYQEYQQILQQVKVLDPACGSGAFLVRVFDYLLDENVRVGEKTGTLFDNAAIYKSILENNLYGVDLNPESVEITKLSLWLKTAEKDKKLNNLDKNIKCGNSLIDDESVAGESAFDWNKKFPEIMQSGGFDVIVGNPPYIRQELFKDIKPYLEKKYECFNSVADLYTYFIELWINLLNERWKFSFILPNKFLKATYWKEIRKFITSYAKVELLLDFNDYPILDDATTYPLIFVISKLKQWRKFLYSSINKSIHWEPITELERRMTTLDIHNLDWDVRNFQPSEVNNIFKKMNQGSILLKDLVDDKIFRGVSTWKNDVFIISEEVFQKNITSNNQKSFRKIVTGKEVKRYNISFDNKYLLFIPRDYDLDSDEKIKEYLLTHQDTLSARPEVKAGRFNRWCLSRYWSKNAEYLFEPKIIYPRINNDSNFYFDKTWEYSLSDNNFFIATDKEYLVPILNSSLLFYYIKSFASGLQWEYFDFRRPYIERLPIKIISSEEQEKLLTLSRKMHTFNAELSEKSDLFLRLLSSKYRLESLPQKIQKFRELDFAELLKTLKLSKLPLAEQADLMQYFEQNKSTILALQSQIDQTDREIDEMVFDLYGLNEEERKIVMES